MIELRHASPAGLSPGETVALVGVLAMLGYALYELGRDHERRRRAQSFEQAELDGRVYELERKWENHGHQPTTPPEAERSET